MRPNFKKRLIMTLIVSVALYGVLILGSQASLSPSEAEQLSEQLEELAKRVDSPYFIFINNFGLSLLMALPFAGPLIAGWIIYETGRYFAAMAMLTDSNPALLVVLPIFLVYGLLEFIGYGGMVTGSIIMSYKILKKQARVEIKYYLLTLLLFSLVILAAAFIEYYIIVAVQNFIGGIQNIV
jgi:NADH:ubiquinone oxidoreductase subunit 6 (subunit J)